MEELLEKNIAPSDYDGKNIVDFESAKRVINGGTVPKIQKIKPSLPKGSKPIGNYAEETNNKYKRQNEAANLFAFNGYKVEMLDENSKGNGYGLKETASPDFLIEGKVFDCYSPGKETKTKTIITEIISKTTDQAPT